MDDEARRNLAAGIRVALLRVAGTKYEQASRMQVSPTTIYKWCCSAGIPRPEHLDRLARLSGLDQETIRNGAQGA